MQHCGCSDSPSFRNANFPIFLTLPKMVYQMFYIAESITKSIECHLKEEGGGSGGGEMTKLDTKLNLMSFCILYH